MKYSKCALKWNILIYSEYWPIRQKRKNYIKDIKTKVGD